MLWYMALIKIDCVALMTAKSKDIPNIPIAIPATG